MPGPVDQPRMAPPDPADVRRPGPPWTAWIARAIGLLEHVQDLVTLAVGVVLLGLAVVLLVSGVAEFAGFVSGKTGPVATGASFLLDRVLLVLIIVEIVYTVVLSLRSHRLVAQPFIIIGLVAVIRRILFVLTPGNTGGLSDSELGLLIAMIAVFVAAQIAVGYFDREH